MAAVHSPEAVLSRQRLRYHCAGPERRRFAAMVATIAALHMIGWGTLLTLVVPQHFSVGDKALGIGVGVTAYTLGLRHAFDADHIAAIDNTTRKLMNDGQRPMAVGFFFSLGHSSVVFGLALLLSFGIKAVADPVQDDSSSLHHYTSLIGTTVSGTFLYLIAIVNLFALVGILRVFAQMRRGVHDEAALEKQLNNRGLLNRFLGRFTQAITKSWQMYPLGVLFGLGFDTATEIALLVLAGTTAAVALPWYAILCLPVLFAAGMCLLDTVDGTFMNFAYGWTLSKPVRKVYYNLTLTGLSVVVALIVGTVELLSLLAQQSGWSGGFWGWIGSIDLNSIGFLIVSIFVVASVAAVLIWRLARVEEKWTARLASTSMDEPSPAPATN
ncbi:HoxN/HupN/NixA family nickel/cobalt transporter (plasmid) [Mycolicibacterium fluoranthenivorans]|uniref:Nickel/cobalt efflux system n=1 Tax=Mycolicibacterium fluoranthenivorans TaxID=258505 RepID=A0A7G8PQH2_9MYCO|nr:HoxN/HupN/NixA family nickel/cobalt transporter [Mycolicibacterium fluoranthenivorans]